MFEQPSGGSGQGDKPKAVESLYAGWINVDRGAAKTEYKTEKLVFFSGGWIELRKLRWSQPVEAEWGTSPRCYSLIVPLSRSASATASFVHGGKVYSEAIAGAYMVPPGQTLRTQADAGEMRSLRCLLDADLIDSLLPRRHRWSWDEATFHQSIQLGQGQIEWLLRRICCELREPSLASEQVIDALARQLAGEIVRKFNLRRNDVQRYRGGLAPWRMRQIAERVRADGALPDLKELANICDLTVRHLCRAFRVETGQTIGKYIEAVMIERACAMLEAGHGVGEIAAGFGYASSANFALAFRRATGLRPSQIKKAGMPQLAVAGSAPRLHS